MPKKQSFWDKLTGSTPVDEYENEDFLDQELENDDEMEIAEESTGMEEDEGELAIDVHQTPDEIVVKAMVAGTRPEDLEVDVTRDMVTVKGKRHEESEINEEDYFFRELYWGSFSRTIVLPEEVEPEEAEAIEKHGLLVIRIPKVDKEKSAKLKIKS